MTIAARNPIFSPTIVVDGRIAGTCARRLERDAVAIDVKPFARLTGQRARAVAAAAERYGRFVGLPSASASGLRDAQLPQRRVGAAGPLVDEDVALVLQIGDAHLGRPETGRGQVAEAVEERNRLAQAAIGV